MRLACPAEMDRARETRQISKYLPQYLPRYISVGQVRQVGSALLLRCDVLSNAYQDLFMT